MGKEILESRLKPQEEEVLICKELISDKKYHIDVIYIDVYLPPGIDKFKIVEIKEKEVYHIRYYSKGVPNPKEYVFFEAQLEKIIANLEKYAEK